MVEFDNTSGMKCCQEYFTVWSFSIMILWHKVDMKIKIAKLARVNVRQQFELFFPVTVSQATRW